jgi:hypothetical protein
MLTSYYASRATASSPSFAVIHLCTLGTKATSLRWCPHVRDMYDPITNMLLPTCAPLVYRELSVVGADEQRALLSWSFAQESLHGVHSLCRILGRHRVTDKSSVVGAKVFVTGLGTCMSKDVSTIWIQWQLSKEEWLTKSLTRRVLKPSVAR